MYAAWFGRQYVRRGVQQQVQVRFQAPFPGSCKRLAEIGRDLLQETSDYELSEAISAIEEIGSPPITELTRRRLAYVFGSGSLATEMDDLSLVSRVWPVDRMKPVHDDAGRDLWAPPPPKAG